MGPFACFPILVLSAKYKLKQRDIFWQKPDSFNQLFERLYETVFKPAFKNLPKANEVKKNITADLEKVEPLG
jgi:hypothetical protein